MTIRFTIDVPRQRVLTTVSGRLLNTDLVPYIEAVLSHPDYDRGMSALVVCRDCKLGSFTREGVQRLSAYTRRGEDALAATRVAVVADQAVVYGFARMYELLRRPPYPFAVFRDVGAATQWLDGLEAGESAFSTVTSSRAAPTRTRAARRP